MVIKGARIGATMCYAKPSMLLKFSVTRNSGLLMRDLTKK